MRNEIPQFLLYNIRFSEFLKHVQKTPKSWEKVCSITIFHQNPEKHSYRPEKPSKLPFFLPTSFPDMSESRFWGKK